MKLMFFFSKCVTFYVNFENAIKFSEMVDVFEDNYIWTCCGNFSQFWREYMW